jgi:hypothetical protein
LSGLQWDIEVSQKQLKDTLDWRAEYKPQDIRLKDLKLIAESGWLYHFGFDKSSRPIIYVLMGKDKVENTEENKLLKVCLKKNHSHHYSLNILCTLWRNARRECQKVYITSLGS